MSQTPPTTQEIADSIVSQVQAALNQTIPALSKSFERIVAKAIAGVFLLLYKYAGFIHLQQFVRTATYDEVEINGVRVRPLQEWGRLFGVSDRVPATSAELLISITVENQTGSLPAGTQLVGPSNGVTYVTLTAVALDAATKQVTVRAVEDQDGNGGEGTVGNLSAGQTMSFANPVDNVNRTATVVSSSVTAADAEAVKAYRARIVSAVSARPQGGAYADYRLWGSEAAGVANVYPYTGTTPGTVEVYVESATETDGIPTAGQLTAVEDAIELDVSGTATRRPVGALVSAVSIARTAWTVTITGLTVSDTTTAQAQITAAVQAYFLDREPFIVGLDVFPRRDTITLSAVTGAIEDVVTALGGTFTSATLAKTAAPAVLVEVYVLAKGEKAKAAVAFS